MRGKPAKDWYRRINQIKGSRNPTRATPNVTCSWVLCLVRDHDDEELAAKPLLFWESFPVPGTRLRRADEKLQRNPTTEMRGNYCVCFHDFLKSTKPRWECLRITLYYEIPW